MKGLNVKLIYSHKKGFTLIEIMVASIIGAFIAVVAVGALRAVSQSSVKANDNIDKAAEIRFATKIISGDIKNLYRDRNYKNTVFVGTIETDSQGYFSDLRFYTVNRIKARSQQPEGDVYEVEYYLAKTEQGSQLMRRLWPNPDKDAQPGGILTVIANDIEVFGVRYFDGSEWQNEWDENKRNLPELVEVTIGTMAASDKKADVESFFVNFARSKNRQAAVFETADEKTENESAAESSDE